MKSSKATVSRRSFLKVGALGAIAATLPPALLTAASAQSNQPAKLSNPTIYRFRVGDFQLTSVTDGTVAAPAALLASTATPQQLAQVLRDSFQSDQITFHCNVLFVNTGRNKVLIDTGSGILGGASAGRLLANLKLAGINPAEIDTIIITHAHPDHIGGVANQAGALVFPKARYFVSQAEWDFWTNPKVSLPNAKVDEKFKQDIISIAQKHLGLIRDKATRFEAGRDIISGFSAIAAPGHTPGQVAIRISSGNTSVVHTADVVHNFAINLWHPEWQPSFDADPIQAVQTRQRLLNMVASDRTLVFAYHFPFPGIGHIRQRNAGGFTWQPITWQFDA